MPQERAARRKRLTVTDNDLQDHIKMGKEVATVPFGGLDQDYSTFKRDFINRMAVEKVNEALGLPNPHDNPQAYQVLTGNVLKAGKIDHTKSVGSLNGTPVRCRAARGRPRD